MTRARAWSRAKASPRSRSADSSRTGVVFSTLLILAAGLFAYANSFQGVFVFDDEPALEHSPHVRTLWPLRLALSAPEGSTLSGRPVASLSFAIDYARSSGDIRAFHETNLLIHLVTALLLFGVVRRTLLQPSLAGAFAAAATPLALIVAAIFVVHPLQTAAVTYLVQRVESLMGLFLLATLYGGIRSLHATSVRARAVWAGAAVASCALGMATKEVMVVAPIVVLLWDRQFASDRAPRRAFHLALAATWLILAALVSTAPRAASAGFGFSELPWWRYLLTQAGVVTHYLRLCFLPSPLVLDYDWRPVASWRDVAGSGVLLAALLAATIHGLRRGQAAAFAPAFSFLVLAPSSSVLPIVTEVAAEHRMYLPVAGITAVVVLSLFAGGRAVARRHPWLGIPLTGVGLATAALIVGMFASLTRARNLDYQDYDRIWSDTIDKRPKNARARNNYATSLLRQGRHAEAEAHLRIAVDERPGDADARANLGVALAAQGRLDEGIEHLERAVRLRPDLADARRNLAEACALEGRLGDAVFHYSVTLESRPDDPLVLSRIAWILATAPDPALRNGARARELADRAVRLTSRRDPDALDALAAAYADLGDFKAALTFAREAADAAAAAGSADAAPEMAARAALYARRIPFRTPVGP